LRGLTNLLGGGGENKASRRGGGAGEGTISELAAGSLFRFGGRRERYGRVVEPPKNRLSKRIEPKQNAEMVGGSGLKLSGAVKGKLRRREQSGKKKCAWAGWHERFDDAGT